MHPNRAHDIMTAIGLPDISKSLQSRRRTDLWSENNNPIGSIIESISDRLYPVSDIGQHKPWFEYQEINAVLCAKFLLHVLGKRSVKTLGATVKCLVDEFIHTGDA
jgi:hypothetical protein